MLSAHAQTTPNSLKDASFEGSPGEHAFSKHWTSFGRAFCENITPHTKVFVAKLFGQFDGKNNYSGVYQDVSAQPDKRYIANAHLRHNKGDTLEKENEAWIKLEFFDSKYNLLSTHESPVKLNSKSPSGRWLYFTTGPAMAPPQTARARFVALFRQKDDAMGSALFDDVELRELP